MAEITKSPVLHWNSSTMFTHLENPYGPPKPEELANIPNVQTASTPSDPFTLPSTVEQSNAPSEPDQDTASLNNQEQLTVAPPRTEVTSSHSAQQFASPSQVEAEHHYRLCGARQKSSPIGPVGPRTIVTESLIPYTSVPPTPEASAIQAKEKLVHNGSPNTPNISSPAEVPPQPVGLAQDTDEEANQEVGISKPTQSITPTLTSPQISQLKETNILPPTFTNASSSNPQLHRLQTWRTKYLFHLISEYRKHHQSWSSEKRSRSAKQIMLWRHASLKALEGLVGWVKESKAKEQRKKDRQAQRERVRKARARIWTEKEEEVEDVEIEAAKGGVCSSCVGGMHLLKCGHQVRKMGECRSNCWGSKEVGMGISMEVFECGECVRGLIEVKRLSAVEEVVAKNDYLDCLPWDEDED